ncbi:uncharacterized protein LOC100907791 [Galendromus occidentalis]|uniref:Uncharacterized protein LOC100907791 n=1 Tax=Galendromus occidentalis TaxID=34638 RepID=A0AAJ6VX81_9ACAR|nr:uncharacterized protein LOC100907791 [Galendromus occidentalis]
MSISEQDTRHDVSVFCGIQFLADGRIYRHPLPETSFGFNNHVTFAASPHHDSASSIPSVPSTDGYGSVLSTEGSEVRISEIAWEDLPEEEKENVVRLRMTGNVTNLRERLYDVTCAALGRVKGQGVKKPARKDACTEMIVVREFSDASEVHVLEFVLLNGSHAVNSGSIVDREDIRLNLARTLRLSWFDLSSAEFPSAFNAKVYSFIGIILAIVATASLVLHADLCRKRMRNRPGRGTASPEDPHQLGSGFVDLPIHATPSRFELMIDE